MAGIVGSDFSAVDYGTTPDVISGDLDSYSPVEFLPEEYLLENDPGYQNRLWGGYSDYRISTPNKWGIAGNKRKSFLDDYYFRIHVTPSFIDAGNLVSQQEVEVKVWNAFLTPETLNQLSATGAEGISVVQPATPPMTYTPLIEHTYIFQIGTDGPSTIDAQFLFDFVSDNYPVQIIGSRVTPWLWRPDWSAPMIERLDWLTNLLPAYDGTEQRVRLREFPRRTLEFAFSATGKMRRLFDSAVYDWGARQWAVPFWPDGLPLSAPISIGATSVAVDTTTRDYHVGGLLMLLSDSGDAYEVAEISAVAAGTVSLARPLGLQWPAATTMVYPARVASLPDSHGFSRFTHDAVFGVARMQFEDSSDWPEAIPTDTYRGHPVLTERPNWIEDVSQEFARMMREVDFATGVRLRFDQTGNPEIIQNHRWFLDGREAISEFRSWAYSRAGKFAGIWVPTWADDLIVTQIIGSAVAAITVENIGYASRIGAGIHRNDIRIILKTGEVFYRRIVSAAEDSVTEETLTLDSTLGITVNPADISEINYMAFMRLDSDGVELSWFSGEFAECAHNMRAIKHDV
jgi:hypothetical protein